jgi:hypothetical protein
MWRKNCIIRGYVPSTMFIPLAIFLMRVLSFVSSETHLIDRSLAETSWSGLIGVKIMEDE